MKKSKLKLAVRKAIKFYYEDKGLTATASKLMECIFKNIDKEYLKLHK